MNQNKVLFNYKAMLIPFALFVLFCLTFGYIFNSKIDLNGDNCNYYMLATSIAQGTGFSDIMNLSCKPSNLFPPGYPLIMSLIRFFTDSFFIQKILNGLFLFFSSLMFFSFLKKRGFGEFVSFVGASLLLFNYQLLHFATMMMSEMSYLFFSVVTLLFLIDSEEKETQFWKTPSFYFLIFSVAYSYHIRTQGMALAVAVFGYYLFLKNWKKLFFFSVGFLFCLLPWMIRNKMMGFGQSRYLDMIMMSNTWRPEEGVVEFGDIVSRFFDTLVMLLTKAVPNSMMPYLNVNYESSSTLLEWFVAILIVFLFILGTFQFRKIKYFFWFYVLATLGIISLYSAPSGNRYLTSVIPFIEIPVFLGFYVLLLEGVVKLKIANKFSPIILFVVVFFVSQPHLKILHQYNKAPFIPNYVNFFHIAEEVNKQLPKQTVVCSRKPELFYMFSKGAVCGYEWTEDDKKLIQGLIDSNVQFVVLEQLGYSSTVRYLYPAIQKNPDLFGVVMHLKDPDTYLLRFEREKAIKKLSDK